MNRARSVLAKRFKMLRGSIALVLRKAVLRIGIIKNTHEPISRYFGNNGSRRNGDNLRISAHNRLLRVCHMRKSAIAINKNVNTPH